MASNIVQNICGKGWSTLPVRPGQQYNKIRDWRDRGTDEAGGAQLMVSHKARNLDEQSPDP